MTTKKAAHWEKKSGNTLGTFAELRVVLVQLLVLSLQELHRLPQRRPARLQFLVLLPQLRNPPKRANPTREHPKNEETSMNKTRTEQDRMRRSGEKREGQLPSRSTGWGRLRRLRRKRKRPRAEHPARMRALAVPPPWRGGESPMETIGLGPQINKLRKSLQHPPRFGTLVNPPPEV